MNEIEHKIMSTIHGFTGSYLLYISCELGIFDIIGREAVTINSIANKCNIQIEIAWHLIRPLVSYELVFCNDELYSLTEAGRKLCSTEEQSLYGYVMFCGRECMRTWASAYEAIRNNTYPYHFLEEHSIFEQQDQDEGRFQIFNNMMEYVSGNISLDYFFAKKHAVDQEIVIVDLGGGTGEIISKFLEFYQKSKGITVDLPHVQERAKNKMKERLLDNRWTFQPGSFFDPLTAQGDVFILSRILHDWADDDSLKILRNIYDVMEDRSVLYVIDKLLPDSMLRRDLNAYMNDLHMWMMCGGKERSKKQFSDLLKKSGFYIVDETCLNEMDTYIIQIKKECTKNELECGII